MARTLSFHGSRRPQPMPVRASRSASRPDAQAARAGFESKDRARFRPSIGRHTRDAVATTPTGRKTPPGRTRKSRSVRRRLCDEPGFTAGTSLDLSARSAKRPLGDNRAKTVGREHGGRSADGKSPLSNYRTTRSSPSVGDRAPECRRCRMPPRAAKGGGQVG